MTVNVPTRRNHSDRAKATMTNIFISENDDDQDPLTASMTKLSMVVVNTKSDVKKVEELIDATEEVDSKQEEVLDVIDLTLDSDSDPEYEENEYKCYKSDQLTENVLEAVRSESFPKNQSFTDFVQIYIDNIPVTSALLKSLVQSNSWLNDEMINAFFKLLGVAYPRSLFLSTFFFTNLVAQVDVHGWIMKATGQQSLFDYDHVIFPINHGNTHWSLGVLYIEEMDLVHYDSLGSSLSQIRKGQSHLTRLLEKEMAIASTRELNVSVKRGKSPRQVDGSSCGVHTCYTAHRIAKGEKLDFTPNQVSDYRKKMAANLALC
jgi:Ulp1 family protease